MCTECKPKKFLQHSCHTVLKHRKANTQGAQHLACIFCKTWEPEERRRSLPAGYHSKPGITPQAQSTRTTLQHFNPCTPEHTRDKLNTCTHGHAGTLSNTEVQWYVFRVDCFILGATTFILFYFLYIFFTKIELVFVVREKLCGVREDKHGF